MRAVRCRGEVVEVVDVPESPGDGVRVRVRSAGICGSDLALIGTEFLGERTLGHEIAGELADGTPVAVEPLSPCGKCTECARGDYNLCGMGPAMVHGSGLDGGMADELLVPERALVPLPAGVALGDACLIEPLAVAVHGLRRARFSAGQRVAVVGGGSIGLCAVAAAKASGADVGLVARHEMQREAGARLGAHEASGAYDLVVEAAGTESALEAAAELSVPGGAICLLGTYWAPVAMPAFALALKEIDVVPASMYARSGAARDIDVAAAMLAQHPEIAPALITHRFPLDAAPEAFATAADRASGAIKVVLEP